MPFRVFIRLVDEHFDTHLSLVQPILILLTRHIIQVDFGPENEPHVTIVLFDGVGELFGQGHEP